MDSEVFKFTVEGPYEIPLADGKKGQYIVSGCPEFWKNNQSIADERGCYIFSMKVGKGYRPVYVGKTSKTFKKECFMPHKVSNHYTPEINNNKGKPVMFFIKSERRQGGPNAPVISDLETYLIQAAAKKNPNLSNIKIPKKKPGWVVAGITGGKAGEQSVEASALKKSLGIK